VLATGRDQRQNGGYFALADGWIRFRLCCGCWHGPHTTDFSVVGIVGVLLAINAGAYWFGAANARHEHERKAWRT
jgi:5-methyltetrahydropteroyltriglutamate--homocysteine methyltransferase